MKAVLTAASDLCQRLIASAAARIRRNIHSLIIISAGAAATALQRTAVSAGALARKSVATASKLLVSVASNLGGRRPLAPQQQTQMLHNVRSPIFPIRVIDVEETLGSTHGSVVFSQPTSWEFHTISHTWSKGVQSWSRDIADKLMQQQQSCKNPASEAAITYNDLFRNQDFRFHECYRPFMDFLTLLRADGVKHVWLDALCINQGSESGEKSQELQNMGSYYAKSLGCYVCAHGFGEGFETWKEQERELVMPRWFNRVWTFQEMLLPKTLIFIFDIHPVIRRTINWSISKQAAQGINGPCKCAVGMRPFPQPRYLNDSSDEQLEEENGTEEAEEEDQGICSSSDHADHVKKRRGVQIICGDSPCTQCGGAALIRRAKEHHLLLQRYEWQTSLAAASCTADLYFIDRECIVRLMIMAKEQLERTVWKHCDETSEWKLLRLETVMQQRDAKKEDLKLGEDGGGDGAWDPVQVAVEISKRDCTHDEDRILSILGLLGVEGAVQLRAGKTLDAQLLHLAQQLVRVNPTALLQLCVAQFAGHATPGMSWAPSLGVRGGLRPAGEEAPSPTWQELHRDQHIYARHMQVEETAESGLLELGRVMRHFVRNVEVKEVLDDGRLLLRQARVLWDCCFVRVPTNQNSFDFRIKLSSHGQTLIKSFQFQAYFSPSSCLLYHRVFVAGHSITLAHQSMVRLEGKELNERLHCFEACLVLLGRLDLPNDEKHEVMMICVGSKFDRSLHKVGIAWLTGLENVYFDEDLLPCECAIGGVEDYMDRFVFKSNELLNQ